jgi:hypothetical protein
MNMSDSSHPIEILKQESVTEREGRDGRIRSKKIVEWFVVQNGECLTIRSTKREARAFIKKLENQS